MQIRAIASRYRFPSFLMATIMIALVLVGVSMQAYYASGAAQLDLSRPEYVPVRSQIATNKKNKNTFDSQGGVNEAVLGDFLNKYKEAASGAADTTPFSPAVLSDEQLGLE